MGSGRIGRLRRGAAVVVVLLVVGLLAIAATGTAHAALSIYVAPEQLAATAPLVVEGQVVRTASGFDPDVHTLATYVTLRVDTVHRGPADLATIVLRELGGQFGDLANDVDAVPVYALGEHVLVFVEAAKDGALRTAGMFYGKFRVIDDARGNPVAQRDLAGNGRLPSKSGPEIEEFTVSEVQALVAQFAEKAAEKAAAAPSKQFLREPAEMPRLLWDQVQDENTPREKFVPLSSADPVRWDEADTGTTVAVNIERARDPLGNPQGAVDEIKRAFAAWTNVPESRVAVAAANDNYNFTGANASSPAKAYPPVNVVLFGDPYADITDPSGCSGTLAIGGYWRSGSFNKTVNNVTYHPALRLYLIFNNAFECFLGNANNLAEVATHEIGHGIGFGHSTVSDAVMRATAYGNNRGPRLGDDDRDAAHCTYPHTLTATAPNGGESWAAGSVHAITWTATAEAGADAGVLNLEYTVDGTTWKSVSSGESNDGTYSWTVPSDPSASAKVRVVRPNRVQPTPAPYPSACSLDPSNAAFTITAATAGTSPDGKTGTALRVVRASAGQITVTWGATCSGGATNYALYEGTLAALHNGTWDHVAKSCAAGTDLTETITPGTGGRWYLVAPLTGANEGRLGKTSAGVDRPAAAAACMPRETSSCP